MGKVEKLGLDPIVKKPSGVNVVMEATTEDIEAMRQVHKEHEEQVAQEVQRKPRARRQSQSRINMAFSDENIEYLRIISRVEDLSITSYINELLDKDRALKAKEKAEAALSQLTKEHSDYEKMRLALLRAVNRISVAEKLSQN